MWTSILKFLSGLVTLANRLIPSWEFQAGKAAANVEQAAIKDKLDNVYDKIDDKYISPELAISRLLVRADNYYSKVPDTKTGP